MILNTIFESLEKSLINDMYIKIDHNLEDGKYREYLVKNILQKVIPSKYAITNGFIIDSKENISDEMDIIIYDRNYVPPFFDETYTVVPIESVLAVVQVKTTLTNATLKKAVKNVNSIDKLQMQIGGKIISANGCVEIAEKRYIQPYKIIISRTADTKLKNSLEKELEDVDMIFNIDESRELLIKNKQSKGVVNEDFEELKRYQNQDVRIDSYKSNKLLMFSLSLLDKLKLINNSIIINYSAYMEGVVHDAD